MNFKESGSAGVSPATKAALAPLQILAVTQGQWGERIVAHVRATQPSDWQLDTWEAPHALPRVIDDPAEFLPSALPAVDLLLTLTESAGLTDLTPDIVQRCQSQEGGLPEVILPVDKHSWAPPGLLRQVKRRLDALGVRYAMPMPFCSLAPATSGRGPIQTFAQRYGRPTVTCEVENGHISRCTVQRGAPCGNTRHVAREIVGEPVAGAGKKAGLLHQYYPCWGGMDIDPVQGKHALLHIAATMTQKAFEI